VVISGVKVTAATSTSFTVTLDSLGSGWTYRVYASTNRPDIYVDNLPTAPHISSLARTPRIGLSGLRYTTKPVWYRVQARKGTYRRTSEIFSVGLKPATPTARSGMSTYVDVVISPDTTTRPVFTSVSHATRP